MTDLLGSTGRFEMPATFEEWMQRYIDRIASQARMERPAAEEDVMQCGLDFYRELFEDAELPEYCADEELQNWCE